MSTYPNRSVLGSSMKSGNIWTISECERELKMKHTKVESLVNPLIKKNRWRAATWILNNILQSFNWRLMLKRSWSSWDWTVRLSHGVGIRSKGCGSFLVWNSINTLIRDLPVCRLEIQSVIGQVWYKEIWAIALGQGWLGLPCGLGKHWWKSFRSTEGYKMD